jgi:recombination protein RecT
VRGAAVEKREVDSRAVAITKEYRANFAEVLPDHIEAKGFVGSAVAALRRDPDLLAAANNSLTSFVNELFRCAMLGHVPGTKEFYLTSRRSKEHGNKPIIVGIEGYRGVIQRMYRSGGVAAVVVREVCANDRFRFVEGVDEKPQHEVDWFAAQDRGPIIGVYAYAKLTNGSTSRVVILSKADLDATQQRSDAGKKNVGPWHTDYRAMCWKTAAHRLEPWVPTSAEYRREQLRAEVAAMTEAGKVNTATGEIVGDDDGDVVEAQLVDEDEGGGDS